MKRIASSDCKGGDDHIYSKEFRAMLDGLDDGGGCIDEPGEASTEKKRRLAADQVRALEKNFEVENKLEPERKVKLAVELGLHPRQVAVWFQNRRARWKTKQLERDYGALKADYDGLKLSCDKLKLDNDSLLKEIKELKEKLSSGEEDGKRSEVSAAKEDEAIFASDERIDRETAAATEMEIVENFEDGNLLVCEVKDGSSDSDSASAVLNSGGGNEDNSNSPRAAAAADVHHLQFLGGGATVNFHVSSLPVGGGNHEDFYFVKIEEQSFLDEESGANLMFSDDEAPSLPWICSDEWK